MKEKVLESEIITDEQPQEEAAEEKETREEIRPEVEGILEIQEDNKDVYKRQASNSVAMSTPKRLASLYKTSASGVLLANS